MLIGYLICAPTVRVGVHPKNNLTSRVSYLFKFALQGALCTSVFASKCIWLGSPGGFSAEVRRQRRCRVDFRQQPPHSRRERKAVGLDRLAQEARQVGAV